MNKVPVSYLQIDPKWKNNDYSASGENTTIGKAGCGPSCVAMVLASLTDPKITPADTCWWSKQNGYKAKNQGTYYTYIKAHLAKYGISGTQVNGSNIYKSTSSTAKNAHTKALAAIKAGNWVIACMGKGNWTSSGHYILWYDVVGSDVLIRDPNSTKSTRIRNKLSLLQNEVKYYWIIDIQSYLKKNNPSTVVNEEDDEVVTKRPINMFGKDYTVDGIFKNGSNYLSPKLLEQAGFKLSSKGSTPIVSMQKVKMKIGGKVTEIDGFSSNGTNYAGVRQIAEALGHKVGWDNATKTITID